MRTSMGVRGMRTRVIMQHNKGTWLVCSMRASTGVRVELCCVLAIFVLHCVVLNWFVQCMYQCSRLVDFNNVFNK
jgi:hypothetical protein